MKKAAVIINVTTNETTYTAIYESGKEIIGMIENMPGTVKKWIEEHTVEGLPVIDTEAGEIIAEGAAETMIASQANAEASKINPAAEMVENTRNEEKILRRAEFANYATIPIDRGNIREIASEGIQAAAFSMVAAARAFTCLWFTICWIVRTAKAIISAAAKGILHAITAAFYIALDWTDLVWCEAVKLCSLFADAFTDIGNSIAPVFWGILEAAANAWEFRNELVREA